MDSLNLIRAGPSRISPRFEMLSTEASSLADLVRMADLLFLNELCAREGRDEVPFSPVSAPTPIRRAIPVTQLNRGRARPMEGFKSLTTYSPPSESEI
jgi:hypothetical protein